MPNEQPESPQRTGGGHRAGTLVPLGWWKEPQYAFGSSARDLLVTLLSYSADLTTDGKIDARTYRQLRSGVDTPEAAEGDLVKGGRLSIDSNGSAQILGWEAFNLSKEEVERRKKRVKEAGQRGGRVRAQNGRRAKSGKFASGDGPSDSPHDRPSEQPGNQPSEQLDIGPTLDLDDVAELQTRTDQAVAQTGDQTRPPSPVPRHSSPDIPSPEGGMSGDPWESFGEEWLPVRTAMAERGFLLPPVGDVDEEGSQRKHLYKLVDRNPSKVAEYIRKAPKGLRFREVVGFLFSSWNHEYGSIRD